MEPRNSTRTYKIGQAAALLDIKPFVLRFWESEFPQLQPIRTDSGQRLYANEHLELVRRIKHLLYEEKLTIDGARKALEQGERVREVVADTTLLGDIEAELIAIRRILTDGEL